MRFGRRVKRTLGGALVLVFVVGLFFPESHLIPVQGATSADWNAHSFWYSPWGKSGVHKGIDIFARKGTPVLASSTGLTVYSGNFGIGGRVVVVLSAKWRLHYYAHLKDADTKSLRWVHAGQKIGSVGNSGDAQGKPSHLHYAILSLIPRPWRIQSGAQGWKRMFYLDPGNWLISR